MKSTKTLLFLLIAVALSIFTIFEHDAIGRTLFEEGRSWTMSKIVPYVLCWVSSMLVLVFSIYTFRNKAIGALVGGIFSIAIIGFDFSQHIIYSGDFSNNSVAVQSKDPQFRPNTLSAITIPGCPFCHASVEMLKVMKARNPQLDIQFLVCTTDSTQLNEYVQPIDGKFDLALFEDLEELNKLGVTGFPTFIYTDTSGKKQMWSNDNFGAPARDFVESINR